MKVSRLHKNMQHSRLDKLGALLEIGKSLASERDLEKLLTMILNDVTQLTDADRSSLLLTDRENNQIWSLIAQGLDKREIRIPITTGIAGHVATTGEVVNVPDAYEDPRFNPEVDQQTGYRTGSMLCAPMVNREGEVIGVIQVLNKLSGIFQEEDEEILLAFAGQAAVAVDNAFLYKQIQQIMESFISASVYAIESRDPATSGHSARVADMAENLAMATNRVHKGPLANVNFTPEQLRELRYAALLHDFGKISVRESVLLKANKLHEHELENLIVRFKLIRRAIESECLKKRVELIESGSVEEEPDLIEKLNREMKLQLERLDDHFATLMECNNPSLMTEGNFEKLKRISQQSFVDFDGSHKPYITQYEFESLSIRKGNLRTHERMEMESHLTQTVHFLEKIPWTPDLKDLVRIAGGHHERLDGSGYPNSITAEDIPYQTRILTIADIYDSLTSMDRPYKKALIPQKALEVLEIEANGGRIDTDILNVFVQAKVYEIKG